MIVNFSEDKRFRFPTSVGIALIEPLRCNKSICIGIEFEGTELKINVLEFAGINSVVRGEDGKYCWILWGEDGNEYPAELEIKKEYSPQIIEIPVIRARYFAKINGGILEMCGQKRIGRLNEGR